MMWFKKAKAFIKGEELTVEHLLSQFVQVNKDLLAHADAKIKEAEMEALAIEQAVSRKAKAELEQAKASRIAQKIRAIYEEA
jgi:hypothetical protein